MDLFSTSTPAQQAADQVLQSINRSFAQLGAAGVKGFNAIWNNPYATPADVVSALGTNAGKVFALASLNIQTVEAAAVLGGATPPTIPEVPPQYLLTFGADGTGTVSPAPTSSSSLSSGSSSN